MNVNDLDTGVWIRDDQSPRILLKTGNTITDPGGLAIWEAEFDGKAIEGITWRRPSEDLSDIKFSRFTLDVSIKIEGTGIRHLTASFVGKRAQQYVDLGRVESDQVVVNNTWYALYETFSETRKILAEHKLQVPGTINLGQLIWLRGKEHLPIPVVDQVNIESLDDIDNIELPDLNAQLYQYQEIGIRFLAHVAQESLGCILADEMGLGKTLQIIGLLLLQKLKGKGPALVVCPATLLENWRREISRFAPSICVHLHSGSQRTGRATSFFNYDAVITSYETAVRDEVLLSSINWNIVVLDEAQNIKNPEAQRTVTVKSLQRAISIAVTGTPVENRLTDLWSIADFVLPGLLGDKKSFESTFDNNDNDASLLAPLVTPIMLRRKVLDVATDLPARLDIDQALVVSQQMADEYERVRNEIIDEYGNKGSLVAIGKLRQLCAHPRVLGLMDKVPIDENPKYRRLLEVMDEIFESGEKVLIFTSYLDMSDLITVDLRQRYPNAWVGSIDGRIDVELRQPLIDEFSAYRGPACFVLNPKAAGTGLNITAANHIIHYNPEWNPALEDQASARAYRRTQTRPVTIHHFFYIDTVEEVIVDRLEAKRSIANNAVTGHEGDIDSANIARAMQISPLNKR
jgi:SNF2 family DNA or RNA helicase